MVQDRYVFVVSDKIYVGQAQHRLISEVENKQATFGSTMSSSGHDRLSQLQRALITLADFVERHKSFINAHMVDFYTQGHWERLVDADIRKDLLSLTDEELACVGTEQFAQLDCVRAGRVPALHSLTSELERHSLSSLGALSSAGDLLDSTDEDDNSGGRKNGWGMTAKKGHEVDAMARMVASLAHRLGIRNLIDLGSGKGYLAARLCAPPHAFRVLAVDSSEARCHSARSRGDKLAAGADHTLEALAAVVDDRFDVDAALGADDGVVCGLHTCGELGPSALKIAVRGAPRVRGLCLVGCCYHLLEAPPAGSFPMSAALRERGSEDPGRNARMLAAQCADRRRETRETLFWRALLQLMLTPEERASGCRVGRVTAVASFADYACRALRRMGRDVDGGEIEVEAEALAGEYAGEPRRQLLAFHQLRIAWAGCVEGLLLLDRLVFLLEQRAAVAEAHLVRIFDPMLSPRCHALVALMKPSEEVVREVPA